MDPGRLKDRVRIEQNVPTVLASGFEEESWVEVKKTWADIQPLQGKELFDAQTFLGVTPARITMRYDPLLDLEDTKLRVVDDVTGDVWQSEGVQDVENRHAVLEIMASKVVGGGQP